MSVFFGAFKTRKPKEFDYKPRYFDPEKEAREQHKREVLGHEVGEYDSRDNVSQNERKKDYKPGEYIGQMRIRRGIVASRRYEKKKQANIVRLIIFISLLFVILWYLLF